MFFAFFVICWFSFFPVVFPFFLFFSYVPIPIRKREKKGKKREKKEKEKWKKETKKENKGVKKGNKKGKKKKNGGEKKRKNKGNP